MNAFTYTMTGTQTITIGTDNGVMSLSVQASAQGGSFRITGNLPFANLTPSPVVLTNGGTVTLSAFSPASPLTGIIIEWISGNVDILIGF
jgi:hypothetical protein